VNAFSILFQILKLNDRAESGSADESPHCLLRVQQTLEMMIGAPIAARQFQSEAELAISARDDLHEGFHGSSLAILALRFWYRKAVAAVATTPIVMTNGSTGA